MKIKNKFALVSLSIAGLGASAFVVASAVDLGVEANNQLGAGVSITETCQPAGVDNDIAVAFGTPAYSAATKSFAVSNVSLSNLAAACNGLDVQVVVADADGDSLGSFAGVVGGTTLTAPLTSAINSEEVATVSVVIYSN